MNSADTGTLSLVNLFTLLRGICHELHQSAGSSSDGKHADDLDLLPTPDLLPSQARLNVIKSMLEAEITIKDVEILGANFLIVGRRTSCFSSRNLRTDVHLLDYYIKFEQPVKFIDVAMLHNVDPKCRAYMKQTDVQALATRFTIFSACHPEMFPRLSLSSNTSSGPSTVNWHSDHSDDSDDIDSNENKSNTLR